MLDYLQCNARKAIPIRKGNEQQAKVAELRISSNFHLTQLVKKQDFAHSFQDRWLNSIEQISLSLHPFVLFPFLCFHFPFVFPKISNNLNA